MRLGNTEQNGPMKRSQKRDVPSGSVGGLSWMTQAIPQATSAIEEMTMDQRTAKRM